MNVTSPAGDQVEVLPIEPPPVLWSVSGPVIAALWFEGPIEDRQTGRVVRVLLERAQRHGYSGGRAGITGLLKLRFDGYVERDVSGKRTYAVRLARLPTEWYERLREAPSEPAPPAPPARASSEAPAVPISKRPERCPDCGKTVSRNNMHRHLTQAHHWSPRAASDHLRSTRMVRGQHLPAVVEHSNGDGEVEVEPILNDIPAIDLMTGMLMALRRDEKVPIRALPTLQEWLSQTERVLVELNRD